MSDQTSIHITGFGKPAVAKLPEETAQLFHNPRFTLQDAQEMIDDLTYRKINDWDDKGLLSCSREDDKAGWRRFSVIDILKLSVITQLRKFGVTTEKIKTITDKLSSNFDVPAGYKSNRIVGVAMSMLEKGMSPV
jgi:DNA-binding transcriptional MerR regulator